MSAPNKSNCRAITMSGREREGGGLLTHLRWVGKKSFDHWQGGLKTRDDTILQRDDLPVSSQGLTPSVAD